EHQHAEAYAGAHVPFPVREIADRLARRIFQAPAHRVVEAPIATDGAFQLALPRLVVGLDQIDAEFLRLRETQDLGDDARLVGAGRQRAIAHAPLARPAG